MPHHSYGPLEDPNEPLAFDVRDDYARRPTPWTLIVSAVVLLVLIGLVVVFYRSGVRQDGDAPRVAAQQAQAPAAAPPKSADGLQLDMGQEEAAADSAAAQVAAAEPAVTVPAPTATTPDAPPPAVALAPPPEQPAARPQPAPRPATPPAPVQRAEAPRLPAAPPPVRTGAPPATSTAPRPADTTAAAAPAPRPVERAAAPAPAGGFAVQIGAFTDSSQASRAYAMAADTAPNLVAGRRSQVQTVTRDGQTLYRSLVAGFPSREQAQEFCAALRSSGRSCLVR